MQLLNAEGSDGYLQFLGPMKIAVVLGAGLNIKLEEGSG